MLKIGYHTSVSEGFEKTARTVFEGGGLTFQFFTRPPRGGNPKAVDEEDAKRFLKTAEELGFGPVTAHAPYTLNPCAADEKVAEYAENVFKDDLQRMESLPGNYYNFHPGCHVGQGTDMGIEKTAELLNKVLWPEMKTTVLIETMAGKGSEIGRTFEEIRRILDLVELKDKVGVCFDTCHTFDGGYDIREDFTGVLKEFDEIIGLSRLKYIHLNDSMNPLGSHKDRHSKIGCGNIGTDAFEKMINCPLIKNIPLCLETPNDREGYEKEISFLKSLYRGN